MAAMSSGDGKWFSYAGIVWDGLTEGEREQLKQLLFHGPVWDGSVISKSDRNALMSYGLATRCCFMGEQGYTAATYAAFSVHKAGRGDELKPRPGIQG
jgi:hypothetical protein